MPPGAGNLVGSRSKTIGVLALQGAFAEHMHKLHTLNVETRAVRLPHELKDLDALIIPGGESTTIGKLAVTYHLLKPLRRFCKAKPVWGTCAGMIFMAQSAGADQPLLQAMDIEVERNAFGRQVDSFIESLYVDMIEKGTETPFRAVFIRSPKLIKTGVKVNVLARLSDGTAVAAQEGKLLVTAFHPELTEDHRLHQYFIHLVCSSN